MKSRKQAPKPPDSTRYQKKKAFFDNLITVYGRNTCHEVLRDTQLKVYRLHLADSNRNSAIIAQLIDLATHRNIEICYHSRAQLARISRNSKQDQGVACDIEHLNYRHYREVIAQLPKRSTTRLIALDGITNPQNLGMIIRSVTASKVHGLLLPAKGGAEISPLVIKASSGTLFKSNILRCEQLDSTLLDFQQHGFEIAVLDARADCPIDTFAAESPIVFVLGNETDGVSAAITNRAEHRLSITMQRGVESLNVAVTAALVAFMTS